MISKLWRRLCFYIVTTGNLAVAERLDAEVERRNRDRELKRVFVPGVFQ